VLDADVTDSLHLSHSTLIARIFIWRVVEMRVKMLVPHLTLNASDGRAGVYAPQNQVAGTGKSVQLGPLAAG